ncbi:MAG: hypothetical protein QOH72_418 [Solirubrobacteraceae bacterium]|jgi:hypothetical protein|nr:hypothetical protein [Solirubrobacteraceae bacterium]
MMGLTDRFEPWARRYGHAPAPPATEQEAPPAAAADAEPEPEPEPARTGRFARRSTPTDPARPTDRRVAGTTRG